MGKCRGFEQLTNKMNKKYFLLLLSVALVLAAIVGYRWVNKPVVQMSEAVCKSRLSASELFNDYANRTSYADSCYTSHVIEVFGKIRSISMEGSNKSLVLETDDIIFGIDCAIDSTNHQKLTNLKEGQDVEIRGECSGMLSDIIMVRCIIL